MAADPGQDLITYDPLSDVTRKERRMLLGLCVLGIALVKVPLVPEKVSALGLDFTLANQQVFLQLYALVLGYFLLAFLIYGLTDYTAWKRTHVRKHAVERIESAERRARLTPEVLEEIRKRETELHNPDPRNLKENLDLIYAGFAMYRLALWLARVRALFEFVVAVLVSAYTIRELLTRAASRDTSNP